MVRTHLRLPAGGDHTIGQLDQLVAGELGAHGRARVLDFYPGHEPEISAAAAIEPSVPVILQLPVTMSTTTHFHALPRGRPPFRTKEEFHDTYRDLFKANNNKHPTNKALAIALKVEVSTVKSYKRKYGFPSLTDEVTLS